MGGWWAFSLVLPLLAPGAKVAEGPNLLRNPGFEEPTGWESAYPRNPFQLDRTVARRGKASARCVNQTAESMGGARQVIELNQTRALPLLVGGWSRAENVTGTKDVHYSIWCDLKYVEQIRPGRIDLAGMAPFAPGTHDWQEARVLITPERPVKTAIVYALFRRHAGTVWFDDLYLHQLPPFAVPALPQPRRRVLPQPCTLSTEDGLRLTLLADGTLQALQIGDRRFTVAHLTGLFVGDYVQRTFWFVGGKVTGSPRRAVQEATLPEAQLRVRAEYVVLPQAIAVRGWVADTSGRDRAVDVCLTLPVCGEGESEGRRQGVEGWKWWDDITTARRIEGQRSYTQRDYPFSALTDERSGIGLAIPADAPCNFVIGYEPEGGLFHVRVKFGLSAEARGELHRRAPFAFLIYRVDPFWGFRDSARRYYALCPQAFGRRAKKEGMWLFAFRPEKLPNPQDYAYWEGGPQGVKVAAKLGILTFPYLIPVQRSILHLPRLPADYAEAMRALAEYAPTYEGWGGRGTKEQIENAGIRDANGNYFILIRNDVGADVRPAKPINMVVFAVNPNPHLLADTERLTPAKVDLARLSQWLEEYPQIAGVYLDSMSAWSGRYLNFRRDHFRYERLPLTYEEQTGQVAAHGKFDGVQFLRRLGEILHPTGRLIFQNLGPRTDHVWHYFYTDICGIEGGFRHLSTRNLNFYRTASYQKPTLLLDYIQLLGRDTPLSTREGYEKYWKYCLLYGLYPSVGRYCDRVYAQHRDLFETYGPILKALSAAGWQPITGAVCSEPRVRLERFGPREGTVYLTVLNENDRAVEVGVELRVEELGVGKIGRITELVSGQELERSERVRLRLDPLELQVLRVERYKGA
ncbi:MAG TPA: hypothetical protein EYP85_06690 [Armatimonadetes bacterium]|nr:hypothetical protein [Armatimonadota bacterium]